MAEGKIGFFGYRNRTETRQNWVGHFGCPFLSRARIVFSPSAHTSELLAIHRNSWCVFGRTRNGKRLVRVGVKATSVARHAKKEKLDTIHQSDDDRKARNSMKWKQMGIFMIPHAARLSHTCFYCSRCSQAFQNVETINKLRGGIQFRVYFLEHNGPRRWVSVKGSPKRIFNDAIPGLRVCRLPPIKRCFITYQNKSKLVTCNCISATHNNFPLPASHKVAQKINHIFINKLLLSANFIFWASGEPQFAHSCLSPHSQRPQKNRITTSGLTTWKINTRCWCKNAAAARSNDY